MCGTDNEDEIITVASALKAAKTDREEWLAANDTQTTRMIQVTTAEGLRVLDQRITDASERLRAIGFTGPIKRVADGDSQLVINSR